MDNVSEVMVTVVDGGDGDGGGGGWNATAAPFQVYSSYAVRQFFASVCLLASVLGLAGNGLVIAAVPLSRKLRTVTNVFVLSLSASDLLSCLALPWQSLAVLSEEDRWPYPALGWLCPAVGAVLFQGSGCSVNTLALIAVNRWVGITKSVATARRLYTPGKVAAMVVVSWTQPFLVAVLPPLLGFGELGYEPKYSLCSWIKDSPYSFVQDYVGTLFFFPVQLGVIAFCYLSILRYVVRTSGRMADRADAVATVSGAADGGAGAAERSLRRRLWRRQLAVTRNLAYIVLAYLACLTPFFVVLITGDNTIPLAGDGHGLFRLTPFAGLVVFCNCCVNPFIYATSHPDFREAFAFMVRLRFRDIPQSQAESRRRKAQAQSK